MVDTRARSGTEARRCRRQVRRSPGCSKHGTPSVSVRKRKPCNNRLNRGCRHVPAGTSTDRHRTFPQGWGVSRNKPYRRARTREIVKRRRRASTPPRLCERVVGRPNLLDLRDMRAVPIHSTTGHTLLAKDALQCRRNQFRDGRAPPIARAGEAHQFAHPATRCCCFLGCIENRSVPIELATSEFVEPHAARQFSPDHVSVGV